MTAQARRWGTVLLASLSWLFGCAKIESPSGGPVDQEAPYVHASYPDSGAVGVGPIDSLALVFSEPMNKQSVETNFFLLPGGEFRERHWRDRTWILRLRDPLTPGRTYVGLLGSGTSDRRKNPLGTAWSFPFSTGDTLDSGRAGGTIHGQRFPPVNLYVYVWPWEEGYPDTTVEGFPRPPLRMGQSDKEGRFDLRYLPRNRPLRVCALYDRDTDLSFQPGVDRWSCLPDSIVLGDTTGAVTGLDIYIADPDEPGTVAGSAVDSLCLEVGYRGRLIAIRAQRDSLREWLEGESRSEERGVQTLSREDSVRIDAEFASFDRKETAALRESLFCALPVGVRLIADTTVVREESGSPQFSWTDVPPGVYHLHAFRDLNGDGIEEAGEPGGNFPYAIDVRPLRVIDDLEIELETPANLDSLDLPAILEPAGESATEPPPGEAPAANEPPPRQPPGGKEAPR